MNLDATRTVRELATEVPNATRIFEKFGIDYCCGGSKPLQTACQQANIPLDEVLRSLKDMALPAAQAPAGSQDFQHAGLSALIEHILATHHKYVKAEIPRLKQLLTKVVAVHCQNHPELAAVQRTFSGLADELQAHMMKEEMVLFPYIEQLEQARTAGRPA